MPSATSVVRLPVTGPAQTDANIGASTRITLTVGTTQKKLRLLRVKVKHDAGAAANFTPRIYSVAAAAAGSINQEFQGAATAVANLHDPEIPENAVFWTTSTGTFELEPGPDAGANNQFDYLVVVEVLS